MLDLTIRQKNILKDILDNEIIDIEDIAKKIMYPFEPYIGI